MCPCRSEVTHLHPWIKRRSISTFKIFFRFEDDLVGLTCLEMRVLISSFLGVPGRKEVQTATVRIGHSAGFEQNRRTKKQ
jgi:hypothetical protein